MTHPRRRPLASAALAFALLVLVAGCSATNGGPATGSGPDHAATGRVTGQVLDEEFRVLPRANVTIPETGHVAETQRDGRFVIEQVPEGTHTLRTERAGYEPFERSITVTEGRALSLTVILGFLPGDEGFYEVFPFVGLQECMWYTPAFKAGCTYPYVAAVGTLDGMGANLTQYGAPDDVQDNQYRYNFTVRPEHTGIVSELAWRANTDASRIYVLELSCAWYDAVVDDCVAPGQTTWEPGNTYARARGVSPLRIEWDHDRPDWLPWVMSRAYLSGDASRPLGLAVDQRVEMFNSVFYGTSVPVGFALAEA